MSSNRTSLASVIVALGLTVGLGACTTEIAKTSNELGPTPTENYAIQVAPHEDQIFLAAHASGLSAGQGAALRDLVQRWRDPGTALIKIQTPAHGGEEVYRATAAIQGALFNLGVSPDRVQVADYNPDEGSHGPIVIGFTRYEARGPDCGKDWGNFTSTAENKVSNNFGCAVTANMAAMISDPHDLVAPRPTDPGDNARRENVLGKYRQGVLTATQLDIQADPSLADVGK